MFRAISVQRWNFLVLIRLPSIPAVRLGDRSTIDFLVHLFEVKYLFTRKIFSLPSTSLSVPPVAVNIPPTFDFPSGCPHETIHIPSIDPPQVAKEVYKSISPRTRKDDRVERSRMSSPKQLKAINKDISAPLEAIDEGKEKKKQRAQRKLALQSISQRIKKIETQWEATDRASLPSPAPSVLPVSPPPVILAASQLVLTLSLFINPKTDY